MGNVVLICIVPICFQQQPTSTHLFFDGQDVQIQHVGGDVVPGSEVLSQLPHVNDPPVEAPMDEGDDEGPEGVKHR